MFDRTTWIALIICSGLLMLNLHYSGKNAQAQHEAQALEQAQKAAQDAAAAEATSTEAVPSGALRVERPEPDAPVEKPTLSSAKTTWTFTTLGGGIEKAKQLDQLTVHDPDQHVELNELGDHPLGALTDLSGQILEEPLRLSEATPDHVHFLGRLQSGLLLSKKWTRTSGPGQDYQLKLELKISNPTPHPAPLGSLQLFTGGSAPLSEQETPNYLNFFWLSDGKFEHKSVGWFKGGFFSKAKGVFQEEAPSVEFAGVENQFFAIFATPGEATTATVRAQPQRLELPASRGSEATQTLQTSLSLPQVQLAPGETRTFTYDFFTGPKRNSLLRKLGEGKAEVMNYGIFSPISRLLNWLLNRLAQLFGGAHNPWSWGLAIIALTIIIRATIWPLHAKSTRTMKRMSKLQPKLAELREKYPDDPNRMNQEMMKLYRTYNINPVGGCLPMLAQIPIFFGFFSMLRSAVELRNESFAWVKDLSLPDTLWRLELPFSIPFLGNELPFNLLPILMAVTMVLQMRMTPKAGDPMQQRIMNLMPLMFFLFCYNFASALALYWTTQNIFSIGQTWLMQKLPEPELKTSKKANGPTWMEKLQARAEEAQKMRQQAQRPNTTSQKKKPRGPRTGG